MKSLFPSTLSVKVILHITAADVHLISFNTVSGGGSAYYSWRYTNDSLQHCQWSLFLTLQHGIYILFPSTLSLVVIVHVTVWDLQLIPYNTVCGNVTAHYRLGSKNYSFRNIFAVDTAHYSWWYRTFSIQNCLWRWYCTLQLGIYSLFPSTLYVVFILTLQLGIYNIFPSTLSVVLILHITVGDIELIPFNIVCGYDTAHWSLRFTTYSTQHSLLFWYCILQRGIYSFFPSNLSVEVILHITDWNQQLILFNIFCGGDTAYYIWGYTHYSLQDCLWRWYCTLQLAIYMLFHSTLCLVMILHIAAWDI
jgi:hypothetical protein